MATHALLVLRTLSSGGTLGLALLLHTSEPIHTLAGVLAADTTSGTGLVLSTNVTTDVRSADPRVFLTLCATLFGRRSSRGRKWVYVGSSSRGSWNGELEALPWKSFAVLETVLRDLGGELLSHPDVVASLTLALVEIASVQGSTVAILLTVSSA